MSFWSMSTGQMCGVGDGNSNGGEDGNSSHVVAAAVARVTRHSSAHLPGGSSPHQATNRRTTLVPASKHIATTGLQDLPIELLEKIFWMTSFKDVSKLRMMCRYFNTISSSILNRKFIELQKQVLHRLKMIIAMLPPWEFPPRSYPLSWEFHTLEIMHVRLHFLQRNFGEHIEKKHCCFFPGVILDEVINILSYLKRTKKIAHPYLVTQELRYWTTVAVEYFRCGNCCCNKYKKKPLFAFSAAA